MIRTFQFYLCHIFYTHSLLACQKKGFFVESSFTSCNVSVKVALNNKVCLKNKNFKLNHQRHIIDTNGNYAQLVNILLYFAWLASYFVCLPVLRLI